MAFQDTHYTWELTLNATPEDLWPLVTNTNRFDRDAGTPALTERRYVNGSAGQPNNARLFGRFSLYGVPFAYVQEPFEWAYPYRFGVVRNYSQGPLARLQVRAELHPLPDQRTRLIYEVFIRPASFLGLLGVPVQGALFRWSFLNVFRNYSQRVTPEQRVLSTNGPVRLAPGGQTRLAQLRQQMVANGADPALTDRLCQFIETADDVEVAQMRPYALADLWQTDRRRTLETCLQAARLGLLDTYWQVMCPLCRNDRGGGRRLRDIQSQVHCEVCNIDFSANFEQSVELVFQPNPGVRAAEIGEFCIDYPSQTPHVLVQQLLQPGESRRIQPVLEPGRYRVRTLALPGAQFVQVDATSARNELLLRAAGEWPNDTGVCSTTPVLVFENASPHEQLFIFERLAWTDQACSATEVGTVQAFRDLFADDVLRPGEQVSVGSLAVVFTDLRNSTGLYRQAGDASAFGLVMDHFNILREHITAENGAIVKTIGDAVMAVFRDPAAALRAMRRAQLALRQPLPERAPLLLKVGIHYGPSIAVTLNERLDYFGTTVNLASRLEAFSTGEDIIITQAMFEDNRIQALLTDPALALHSEPLNTTLKGFDQEAFQLWRITTRASLRN